MVDATQIERALGRGGTAVGDVFKVSVPRADVKVTLDGFEVVLIMGLTSWAAFRRSPHGVTVMGDIVALEDEIPGAVRSRPRTSSPQKSTAVGWLSDNSRLRPPGRIGAKRRDEK